MLSICLYLDHQWFRISIRLLAQSGIFAHFCYIVDAGLGTRKRGGEEATGRWLVCVVSLLHVLENYVPILGHF